MFSIKLYRKYNKEKLFINYAVVILINKLNIMLSLQYSDLIIKMSATYLDLYSHRCRIPCPIRWKHYDQLWVGTYPIRDPYSVARQIHCCFVGRKKITFF